MKSLPGPEKGQSQAYVRRNGLKGV